jgi:hypothetical protein
LTPAEALSGPRNRSPFARGNRGLGRKLDFWSTGEQGSTPRVPASRRRANLPSEGRQRQTALRAPARYLSKISFHRGPPRKGNGGRLGPPAQPKHGRIGRGVRAGGHVAGDGYRRASCPQCVRRSADQRPSVHKTQLRQVSARGHHLVFRPSANPLGRGDASGPRDAAAGRTTVRACSLSSPAGRSKGGCENPRCGNPPGGEARAQRYKVGRPA